MLVYIVFTSIFLVFVHALYKDGLLDDLFSFRKPDSSVITRNKTNFMQSKKFNLNDTNMISEQKLNMNNYYVGLVSNSFIKTIILKFIDNSKVLCQELLYGDINDAKIVIKEIKNLHPDFFSDNAVEYRIDGKRIQITFKPDLEGVNDYTLSGVIEGSEIIMTLNERYYVEAHQGFETDIIDKNIVFKAIE